ncbi:MAG TPA: STAS domain-containing protein [Actinomycetospora sp.]|nr:STAS domain-containing protein [Actinomycetospora sp.]
MPEDTGCWLITDTFTTTSRAVDGVAGAVDLDVGVLRVFGEIDLATHAAFDAGLDRVLGGEPDRIVVDCTAMAFCGARGLSALMATVAVCAERGTDVAVVGLSPVLHRLCRQLWPGPQPAPYPRVTDAIADAANRCGTSPVWPAAPSAMTA